jgi:hypothetical protein
MRAHILIAVVSLLALAGCYSKTVEKPVVVQPQPTSAVVVPVQ